MASKYELDNFQTLVDTMSMSSFNWSDLYLKNKIIDHLLFHSEDAFKNASMAMPLWNDLLKSLFERIRNQQRNDGLLD